ncbi:MAG: STAS domain-containing protein [Candidatus Firestonebacteria bacterium]|nr:STAS domain-containing protein [Candidatus Firestonebacteria bacterium]
MSGLTLNIEMLGAKQDIAVVRMSGYIDTHSGPGLAQALNKIFEGKCNKIVCDLENVNYISSAGWGVFIGEIGRVRNLGGDLKLAAMLPEVEEVYKVLEFDVILKHYPDLDEALRHFN